MDWQVIILTLGASLITGAVSLLGNIIVSKSNIKKSILENRELNKKDFFNKRLKIYDKILTHLKSIEIGIEKKEDINKILEECHLESFWKSNYHYCSTGFNERMRRFLHFFDGSHGTIMRITAIRDQAKFDFDHYYGLKDQDNSK